MIRVCSGSDRGDLQLLIQLLGDAVAGVLDDFLARCQIAGDNIHAQTAMLGDDIEIACGSGCLEVP